MFLFNPKKRRELEKRRDLEADRIVKSTLKKMDKAMEPIVAANKMMAAEDVRDIAINLVYAIRGDKK